MSNIVQFVPRAGVSAQQNLDAFCTFCTTELTVFGQDLPFEENVWDITESLDLVGKNHSQRLVFSSFASVNDSATQAMAEPFLSFAKAYMRYQHSMRPTKSVGSRLSALRALEAALVENEMPAAPWAVTSDVLNRAAKLIREKFTAAVAYRVGGQLEMLSEFLSDKQLTTVPVQWVSPLRRPADSARVGEEFDKRRQEKLPSPAALHAIATAFRLVTEPADILVCSAVAILCSAPDRINELLDLDLLCEVTQAVPSTGLDAYGLRWFPSKGAAPMVKWILGSMTDVVKMALVKIRQVTEPARQVARWYQKHPGQLYLLPQFEYLRKQQRLTIAEIKDVLFASPVTDIAIRIWCKNEGVVLTRKAGQTTAAFDDVQKAVVAMLPTGFPVSKNRNGLKYGDTLFLVQKNLLHSGRPTYRCAIDKLEQGDVYNRLGARSSSGIRSIFDKCGLTEDDGSSIVLSSHQFRHYLNTLAQTGGLSQLDIAKWSGRANVSQNAAYDHQSSRDVLALVRQAIGDSDRMVGPLSRLAGMPLIKRDEFARLKVQTAHVTDYGHCIHDFTMLPCQVNADCINCTEQICVKGDKAAEKNIRFVQRETRQLLQEATVAAADDWAGADRWVAHQSTTLARLDQLCEILDDPRVPEGAIIQLSDVVPASRLAQATQQRLLTVETSHLGGQP